MTRPWPTLPQAVVRSGLSGPRLRQLADSGAVRSERDLHGYRLIDAVDLDRVIAERQ